MNQKQQVAMSGKNPPEKKPISEAECLFTKDRIPNEELPTCLAWEFLRESATARNLAAEWAKILASEQSQDDEFKSKMREGMILVINYPFAWRRFTSYVITEAFARRELQDWPWQTIDKEVRSDIDLFATNAPAFIGFPFHASQLNSVLQQRESTGDFPDQASAIIDKPFTPGMQLLLMVFDWGQYDVARVKAEAHRIIDNLSPPTGFKPQFRHGSGLGRADEWRGKLSDLGLARISARYHARQLQREQPNLYAIVAATLSDKGPTAVEKKLASARRRFKASFHQILPLEKSPPHCLANSRFAK